MEALKKIALSGLLLILIVSIAVPLASAQVFNVVEATFFLYYGTGVGGGTDQYDLFSYDGIHWSTSAVAAGVKYYVNPKYSGVGSAATVEAVKAAFGTWDAAVDEYHEEWMQEGYHVGIDLYVYVGTTGLSGSRYDRKNVVSWGSLRVGILAQTTVWYYSGTKEIVEFGMVFNRLYKWGIDPDGEGGTTINAFDIQNIATHEAGHTLMLGDLYKGPSSQLTMYGYGSKGEVIKRTLGYGDIHGAQHIYCGAYAPLIGTAEPS